MARTANSKPTKPLEELESAALSDIRNFLKQSSNPVIAFSGGKDAIVTTHLVHQVAEVPGVCETSFYYARQMADIEANTRQAGWRVAYRDSLPVEWLQARPEVPFSDNANIRSSQFQARQQTTVRKEVERFNYSGAIFGRRTQENSVPSKLYIKDGKHSFHPIREWSEADVWAYFDKHNIPVPWIYKTKHGEIEGNSPFITLRAKPVGGLINAWRLASELDERYQPSFMGSEYENNLRRETAKWYW